MQMIRPKQIRIIKMAQRRLGLDDATYRAMLRQGYGVDSCTRLNAVQADALIDRLQKQGFEFKPTKANRQWRKRTHGGGLRRPVGTPRQGKDKVVTLATAAEIEKINAIASLISWRYENGLQLFLERRMGIKGGRVRTADEAYRAIEGLKKMFEHAMEANNGPEWWTLPFDESVETYIIEHAPAQFRSPVTGEVYKRPPQPTPSALSTPSTGTPR
jgi:hypothetical protein